MEPRGYSHLICFIFILGIFSISYPKDNVRLTEWRKRDSERLLKQVWTCVPLPGGHTAWRQLRGGKDDGQLVRLGFDVTAFTPASYQRRSLRRPCET